MARVGSDLMVSRRDGSAAGSAGGAGSAPGASAPGVSTRGASALRLADDCGWVRGPRPAGSVSYRPTRSQAEEAAADLLKLGGRDRVLRLLGSLQGYDLRFVDDALLLLRLAAAIRSGAITPVEGDGAEEAGGRWHAVRVLGADRVLIGLSRRNPGLRRMPMDKPGLAERAAAPLMADAVAREHLLSLVETLGPLPDNLGVAGLSALVVAALQEGTIHLFYREDGGEKEDAARPPPSTEKRTPKSGDDPSSKSSVVDHWIEIVLLDDDMTPMAGEKYEITLPDGSLRRGALDDQGKAKITGLAQGGACQVGFPDIDAREWRPA